MPFEVELKFPLDDESGFLARLAELGGVWSAEHTETDTYFNHPARDFARTDEALRLRRREGKGYLTYKGPKIDSTTKTRREIELPLPVGESEIAGWMELLKVLGFLIVGEVRKKRRKARLFWQGRPVEISLDRVEQLGTFVELETVAETAELDAARKALFTLAEKLGLRHSRRESYLELLLQVRRSASG